MSYSASSVLKLLKLVVCRSESIFSSPFFLAQQFLTYLDCKLFGSGSASCQNGAVFPALLGHLRSPVLLLMMMDWVLMCFVTLGICDNPVPVLLVCVPLSVRVNQKLFEARTIFQIILHQ